MRQARLAFDETLCGEQSGLPVESGTGLLLEIRIDGVIRAENFLERTIIERDVTPESGGFILRFGAVALDVQPDTLEIKIFELLVLKIVVDQLFQRNAFGQPVQFRRDRRTADEIKRNLHQLQMLLLVLVADGLK